MTAQLSTQDRFTQIETNFHQLVSKYSTTTSKISETISFGDADLEDAKEKLAQFVVRSEELANRETFKERSLRMLSRMPIVGKQAKSAIRDIREEMLEDESVSSVVNQLYDGITHQSDNLEATISKMYDIAKETNTLTSNLVELDTQLDEIIQDTNNIPDHKRTTFLKISSQLKMMISNSQDKIQELSVIVRVAESVLMNIVKVIPVTKSELLSRIVMDAGVSQINAIQNDVKDIMELNTSITDNMNKKTRTAIMAMIDSSTITKEDVDKITASTNERMKLMQEISEASIKQQENIISAHTQILESVDKANKNRTLLDKTLGDHTLTLENKSTGE